MVAPISASAIRIQRPGINTSASDSDAFSRNNIGCQGAHFVAPRSIRAGFVNSSFVLTLTCSNTQGRTLSHCKDLAKFYFIRYN